MIKNPLDLHHPLNLIFHKLDYFPESLKSTAHGEFYSIPNLPTVDTVGAFTKLIKIGVSIWNKENCHFVEIQMIYMAMRWI